MQMMKYTLSWRLADTDEGSETVWFDILTTIGVVGKIDTTRLVLSFKIIDCLTGKNGRSV